MKHWALLFLWFVPITIVKAQNVSEDDKKIAVDSFEIRNVKYLEMNETVSPHADIFKLEMPEAVMPAKLQPLAKPNPQAYTLPHITLENPTVAWKGGYVTAVGTTMDNPGLLDIASGGLMATQQFGNLRVSAMAEANKYNFMWQGGVRTQYGVSGELSLKVSVDSLWSFLQRDDFHRASHDAIREQQPIRWIYHNNVLRAFWCRRGSEKIPQPDNRTLEHRPYSKPFSKSRETKMGF